MRPLGRARSAPRFEVTGAAGAVLMGELAMIEAIPALPVLVDTRTKKRWRSLSMNDGLSHGLQDRRIDSGELSFFCIVCGQTVAAMSRSSYSNRRAGVSRMRCGFLRSVDARLANPIVLPSVVSSYYVHLIPTADDPSNDSAFCVR